MTEKKDDFPSEENGTENDSGDIIIIPKGYAIDEYLDMDSSVVGDEEGELKEIKIEME